MSVVICVRADFLGLGLLLDLGGTSRLGAGLVLYFSDQVVVRVEGIYAIDQCE